MLNLMPYLKAVSAAVIVGLATLEIAYADDAISNQEYVKVAGAFLVALGGVWAIPNAPRK